MVYRVGGVAWPAKQESVMQIYWTLRSIPELSELPSEEMWRVWRAAYRKTTRHWLYWVSLVGIFAVCIHIGDMRIGRLGTFIGLFVGFLIHTQISLHLARPYIRDLLSSEHASGQ